MKHTHAPSDTTRNTPERIPFPEIQPKEKPMNKRQAFRQFVKDAPDLSWQERATLRFAAITCWDEIETLLNSAAAEKAGLADAAALEAPGAPTIDWLALLMELLPIILKFFFNK